MVLESMFEINIMEQNIPNNEMTQWVDVNEESSSRCSFPAVITPLGQPKCWCFWDSVTRSNFVKVSLWKCFYYGKTEERKTIPSLVALPAHRLCGFLNKNSGNLSLEGTLTSSVLMDWTLLFSGISQLGSGADILQCQRKSSNTQPHLSRETLILFHSTSAYSGNPKGQQPSWLKEIVLLCNSWSLFNSPKMSQQMTSMTRYFQPCNSGTYILGVTNSHLMSNLT